MIIILIANLLSLDYVPGTVLGAIQTIPSHSSSEEGTAMEPILQTGSLPFREEPA